MPIFIKIAIATLIIVGASWLSGKRPELAGFITALPLVSIVALAFAYQGHGDSALVARYARSIMLAVPVSWLFFLPFFFAEKWNLNFWHMWGAGLALLVAGYGLHRGLLHIMPGN